MKAASNNFMRYRLQTIPFFRRVRLTFTAVSWKPSEISGASADPLSCSIHLPWAQSVLSVPPLLQVGNVLSYFLAIPKLSALGNSHLLSDMPARAEKRDKRAERFQCWLANPYLKKGMQNQIEFKSWKKEIKLHCQHSEYFPFQSRNRNFCSGKSGDK